MNDSKTVTDGTGTTSYTGKIHFLNTMLRREALREFNNLVGQVGNTNNGNIKLIKEILLGYFTPINALTKHKRTMKRAIRKPWDILFKIFDARLTEMNNYLTISLGSSAAKKTPPPKN